MTQNIIHGKYCILFCCTKFGIHIDSLHLPQVQILAILYSRYAQVLSGAGCREESSSDAKA